MRFILGIAIRDTIEPFLGPGTYRLSSLSPLSDSETKECCI